MRAQRLAKPAYKHFAARIYRQILAEHLNFFKVGCSNNRIVPKGARREGVQCGPPFHIDAHQDVLIIIFTRIGQYESSVMQLDGALSPMLFVAPMKNLRNHVQGPEEKAEDARGIFTARGMPYGDRFESRWNRVSTLQVHEGKSVYMNSESSLEMRFVHSGETVQVGCGELRQSVVQFLERYGAESFLGKEFGDVIGQGTGEEKFARLLNHCAVDEQGFFSSVMKQLENANHLEEKSIVCNGLTLPKNFMLSMLEVIIPGSGFVSVKDVSQYEMLTNTSVAAADRENLQAVIDKYPVRLSKHVIRQSRLSTQVAYQFMPFLQELDESGHKNTWIGQFHQGLLEQMYQNRPIFVLHMSCPVYCRFCFRKHKDCRNLPTPTTEDVGKALQYIEATKDLKEIVLTGGEPLMNKDTLICAVEGLGEMEHIQTIRVASRCISYFPNMFYKEDSFWLRYLVEKNRELVDRGKRIEVATHFIHPDEVSHYSLDIISHLVSNGVPVYTQTPFLKDCNDSGHELADLYRQLRGAGSEMHYIYIPCSPIQGNNVYWTEIVQGHRAAGVLRAEGSDRAMPIICTATSIGKIDWNASGWAVAPSEDNPHDIWIRTPYSEDYYKKFAPNFTLMSARPNEHGTLDIPFMAEIGGQESVPGAVGGRRRARQRA